jgi:hypothetical protein
MYSGGLRMRWGGALKIVIPIRGEEPVPTRAFLKLRPVSARSPQVQSRVARGSYLRKIQWFCRKKKLKFNFYWKNFGILHFFI